MTNCEAILCYLLKGLNRPETGLLQKQLASALNIDISVYSRIKREDRQAKREQVIPLSDILNIGRKKLLSLWIADRINAVIVNDKIIPGKALKMNVNNRIWK